MTTRAAVKNGKNKKSLETTLGKASSYSSNASVDLSHIRKPVDTSIFGLRQVLTLFETATEEVRRYVTYECDIMYECRICRTIYRSLANFILHKRNYCRESYNPNDHTNCRNSCQENEFVVHEEELEMSQNFLRRQRSRETSPVLEQNDLKRKQISGMSLPISEMSSSQECKKLNSVLHRLMDKQESEMITKQCTQEDISNESKTSEKEGTKNNVSLQTINDSKSGVFQTMFRNMIEENRKIDLMKTEVLEIHDILENNEAIIGPDGKIVISDMEKNAVLKNNYTCTICSQKFSTRKTLSYHSKYKHNNSRLIYQCPECDDTFANTWSVFRHLYKVHRKSTAQVKRLRNQIHANIMRRDEQPPPKENSSTMNVILPPDLQGKLDMENKQWMDDFEGHNDLQCCGGCGRKFERKAALHSHSQFCTKRIAVCNIIKENTAKRTQTEEKLEKLMKASKINTLNVPENTIKRLNRRKPLVSRKIYRIDSPENETFKIENDPEIFGQENLDKIDDKVREGYQSDEITKACENDNRRSPSKIGQENEEHCNNEINDIYKNDDTKSTNDFKNEKEDGNVGNAVEQGRNNQKCLHDNCPRSHGSKRRRCSTSSNDSSNDVIYINTVQYSIKDDINNENESSREELADSDTIAEKQCNISCNQANVDNFSLNESKLRTDNLSSSSQSLPCKIDDASQQNNFDKTEDMEISDETKQISSSELQCSDQNKNEELIECNEKVNVQVNHVKKTLKTTLESKSLDYIEKEKQMCRPCNRSFKSLKSLMKHMAIHFSWYRYECKMCSYKSYTRSKCERHIECKHGINDQEIVKTVVLHMLHLKTVESSTDFVKDRRRGSSQCSLRPKFVNKMNEIKTNGSLLPEEMDKLSISARNSNEDSKQEKLPDAQDPTLRKMIMEVIFGSNSDSSRPQSETANSSSEIIDTDETTETNSSETSNHALKPQKCNDIKNSSKLHEHVSEPLPQSETSRDQRPVRNRVTPVQKDFLYDMKQILKPAITLPKDLNKKKKYIKANNVKKTKLKQKETLHVANTVPGSNKITIVKGDANTYAKQIKSVQDINMNSQDL